MTRLHRHPISVLQWLASILLAAVFIAAALPKINAVGDFATTIDQYQLLPSYGVTALALSLPWIELVAGLGLLAPIVRSTSRWLCAGLLLVFIVVHISALARGLSIHCACFGNASTGLSPSEALARNACLLALALGIIYLEARKSRHTAPPLRLESKGNDLP